MSTIITSSVVVCNNKVITNETGQLVFSALLTLVPVHYAYDIAYNPITQQVLEFFQEKVLSNSLERSLLLTPTFIVLLIVWKGKLAQQGQ